MTAADLEMVEGWLRRPHVATWYLAISTIEDEIDDLRRCVTGREATRALVVEIDRRPVGWCQWYLCGEYPEHAAGIGAGAGDVGIDYAIGDPTQLGLGLGTALVAALVQEIRALHPDSAVVSNPDAGNLASRRVLEKNGFKLVREAQVASERSQTPVAIYRLAASGSGGNDL